jgi:hypothetical protein
MAQVEELDNLYTGLVSLEQGDLHLVQDSYLPD